MGIYRKRIIYKEGDILGVCTYLSEEPKTIFKGRHTRYAKFRCVCGKEFISGIKIVKNGGQCGCGNIKHGGATRGKTSPEYRIYMGILQRCYNPKDTGYYLYGGNGIGMSDEWKGSFLAFLKDMGLRPSPIHSVDRIDGMKGYCKENCKWSTPKEQAANRLANVFYEYKGEQLILSEISRRSGVSFSSLKYRITVKRWSVEKATSITGKLKPKFPKKYEYNNQKLTLKEISDITGVSLILLISRIRKWDIERCISQPKRKISIK